MPGQQLPTETAPDANTYDLTPPRRPGLADVNNAGLVNDAQEPPPDMSFPSAALINTIARMVVAAHKVTPGFLVTLNASQAVTFFQTQGDSLFLSSTLAISLIAAGNVQVQWPTAKFPALAAVPQGMATLNVALGANNYAISVVGYVSGANSGVNVYTVQNAVLTTLPFTLSVW